MNYKDEFICDQCHKIQKDPIYLPCRCSSICKFHIVTNNEKATITCQACHKMFLIEGGGGGNQFKEIFKENFPLKKLIENDFHLSDDEKKFKFILTKYVNDLENDINELQHKCAEFSLTQYDHFANIRREIDIKRETIIQEIYGCDEDDNERKFNNSNSFLLDEIHRYSTKMISQVECVEEAFRLNFNKVKVNLIEINVESERANLSEFLRNPHLTRVNLY